MGESIAFSRRTETDRIRDMLASGMLSPSFENELPGSVHGLKINGYANVLKQNAFLVQLVNGTPEDAVLFYVPADTKETFLDDMLTSPESYDLNFPITKGVNLNVDSRGSKEDYSSILIHYVRNPIMSCNGLFNLMVKRSGLDSSLYSRFKDRESEIDGALNEMFHDTDTEDFSQIFESYNKKLSGLIFEYQKEAQLLLTAFKNTDFYSETKGKKFARQVEAEYLKLHKNFYSMKSHFRSAGLAGIKAYALSNGYSMDMSGNS